eukprot:scaffold11117_cov20-Tisochrysis_lutea.AAC.2
MKHGEAHPLASTTAVGGSTPDAAATLAAACSAASAACAGVEPLGARAQTYMADLNSYSQFISRIPAHMPPHAFFCSCFRNHPTPSTGDASSLEGGLAAL